jgi:hypothetical protein
MSQNDSHHGNDPQHGPRVTISINGTTYEIHRGRQTVATIKHTGSVAAAEELEQVIDGVFNPLPDDGTVTIKGGEVFISHVRASAAS